MDINPYTPPAAMTAERSSDAVTNFRTEQRSVLLCIVLTVVTLGFYQPVWLLRRRPFLNAFAQTRKLGVGLPIAVIVTRVLAAFASSPHTPHLDRLFSAIAAAVYIIPCFRVAHILRAQFKVTGHGDIKVSMVLTFLFGVFYLQYKVNEAADRTPARIAAA